MKLVKPQRTYGEYKGRYDAAFLKVAFRAFLYKLVIGFITMVTIYFGLAFISLVPMLNFHMLLLMVLSSAALAFGYCWTDYSEMLDAKNHYMNNLFK